jgi:hypothetical protein
LSPAHLFDRGEFYVRVHASPHFVRPSASWIRMNESALAQVVCHEVPSPTKRQSYNPAGVPLLPRDFPFPQKPVASPAMSTITAILEPHADGSLHLPLPPEMRHGKVRVEAKLEALPQPSGPGARPPNATPLEAFKVLRAMGGLRRVIPDPVAWQREQRAERSLPGRD